MSTQSITAVLLIAVPIGFNVAFSLLAARFDYPDILRKPTGEVLERFRDGGTGLVLLWWAFVLTAVALVPVAVLLSSSLTGADSALLTAATTVGVLAGAVQFLGLVRWPFLVPYLARVDAEPDASPARREAVDVVFQSFNRYLGVAVGEHLGYAFTGVWTILSGAAIAQSSQVPSAIGAAGIVIGTLLLVCAFEFVGRNERHGWSVAEKLTPIAYVMWSLWLVTTGVALFA